MQINIINNINNSFGTALYDESKVKNLYNDFFTGNFTYKPVLIQEDQFNLHSNILDTAFKSLESIEFNPEDVQHIKKLGAKICFNNGKEAIDFAAGNKISIIFDEVDHPDIHAQWSKERNTIVINQKYKNEKGFDIMLAISASIMHELSHAKDKDYYSSIQEEVDCLAMNSLVFNAYNKKYPNAFKNSVAPIIKDGVELYAKLFFSPDSARLIKRISEKYGDLPIESPNHKANLIAHMIKQLANEK
ncbi:MAG: hypothetical protein PHX18_05915 [Candidatus Gastranaerophilales bacterium]|nr:hypothetical protein [Candidatus Gastranaerophilales bacterium]